MKSIVSIFISILLCLCGSIPINAQTVETKDEMLSVMLSEDEATFDEATPDMMAMSVSTAIDDGIVVTWDEIPCADGYIFSISYESDNSVYTTLQDNIYKWNPYIEGNGFVFSVIAYNESGTLAQSECVVDIHILGVWDDVLLYGDADLNSEINIKDATLVQKSIAKLAVLDKNQTIAADTDADGEITIKDATEVQRFSAGIIHSDCYIGTVYENSGVLYKVDVTM